VIVTNIDKNSPKEIEKIVTKSQYFNIFKKASSQEGLF
jgi:hypothetical protein